MSDEIAGTALRSRAVTITALAVARLSPEQEGIEVAGRTAEPS
jgi:hypothetical protein